MCLAPLIPITARLTQLQLLDHRRLAAMASGEFHREHIEIILRGKILDRSGKVLVQSLPSGSSFLDPSVFRTTPQAIQLLANALRLDPAQVRSKARGHGRFTWLKRRVSLSEIKTLQSLHLIGVGITPEETRFYPNGDLARNILGTVGIDGHGLSGLEGAYESSLGGNRQRIRVIRDGSGRNVLLGLDDNPKPPADLTLTLDRNIQHYAQQALLEGVHRHLPRSALVLVQDPKTGEVLAVASYPEEPLKPPVILESFEPGSTWKIVTAAAVLEDRLTTTDERLDAEEGVWEVAPRVILKDHEPYGALSLAEAMERSSNIVMAKLGLRLGPERFYQQARRLGFGTKTGLSLPGESPGTIKSPRESTRVILANNAFGQGLTTTPLQLIGAYSAIANGGTLLEPRLVQAIGNRWCTRPVPVRRIGSEETIRALSRMLQGVVEHGTGVSAQVPGYSMAGKTGTAQKIDPATGRYSKTEYVASYIGYGPVADPPFTILVLLDNPKVGYYGSDVAAPIFAKLMRQLLALKGVAPDRSLLAQSPQHPGIAKPQ